MHKSSHMLLGEYLAMHYMPQIPARHTTAFLFGCVQPDKNPITYLKGSIRFQLLRGHNYKNALHRMARLSARLSSRQTLSLVEYYSLGKLIHYTADAFTYPHNDFYKQSLKQHRQYEKALHAHLAVKLASGVVPPIHSDSDIISLICDQHAQYVLSPKSPKTDCTYILNVCSTILISILQDKYSSFTEGPNVLGVAVESN